MQPLKDRQILVVEDDRTTADFITFVLEKRGGAQVRHYSDPEEALGNTKIGTWDAVVTDVRLPSMDGVELAERLHDIDEGLPIVVMTAFPSFGLRVRSARADSYKFLVKPVMGDLLLETVVDSLELH